MGAKISSDVMKEINLLPKDILEISLINHIKGIEYCESAEDYLEMLDIYRSSIEAKAQKLEKYLEDMEIKLYTITVHSLKSTSIAIGAETIFEQALKLEHAGKDNDIETIQRDTGKLLKDYRSIKECLDNYFDKIQ